MGDAEVLGWVIGSKLGTRSVGLGDFDLDTFGSKSLSTN
jgi:hypothetical protein